MSASGAGAILYGGSMTEKELIAALGQIRGELGEVKGELVGIREHLATQNNRIDKGEKRAAGVRKRVEGLELKAAFSAGASRTVLLVAGSAGGVAAIVATAFQWVGTR